MKDTKGKQVDPVSDAQLEIIKSNLNAGIEMPTFKLWRQVITRLEIAEAKSAEMTNFRGDPKAIKRLIVECEEAADNRRTSGNAIPLLRDAIATMEMYIEYIERPKVAVLTRNLA